MAKTHVDWMELDNNSTDPSDTDSTRRGIAAVGTDIKKWTGAAWETLAAGAGATTFVALTDTPANYTSAANKILKVNTGGTAVEFVTLSGDISIDATGTAAIGSLVIVDADINASAAITLTKLAATTVSRALVSDGSGFVSASDVTATELGYLDNVTSAIQTQLDGKTTNVLADASVFVGDATDEATAVAITGDVALTNAGVTTVTDLTITSEAQGDILYRNATNWVRLAAGTSGKFLKTQGAAADPMWDTPVVGYANALASVFTVEGGTYDPATTVTVQTGSAAALTIPDLAGVAQEWVFSAKAQTLTNKTLTSPTLTTPVIVTTGSITDDGGNAYLTFVENAAPRDSIQITQGAVGAGATIASITADTNADLILSAAGSGDVVIANGTDLTFDRATFDALVVVADQTGEAHTFNIPDIATGASDTFAFLAEAQTLTNKTLTSAVLTTPKIADGGYIADANGNEALMFGTAADAITYAKLTNGATTVMPRIQSEGEDNIGLMITGKGTGNVVIADAATTTKQLAFSLVGASEHATTLTVVHTEARALTLPDATDTLVGKATTDTFTNKSFNCDGTGNALTNVNATELDPISIGAFGVPFLYTKTIANVGGDTTVVENSTFKFRVLDAWSVATSADGGTWKLKSDVGDITDSVTVAANDKDIDKATQIDDATHEIAATTGDLFIESTTTDAEIYILCMRVD